MMFISKRVLVCSVPECRNTQAKRYKFPKKDERIRKIWLQRINNPTFIGKPTSYITEKAVCDIHFEEICKRKDHKLKNYSLPTLYIPGFAGVDDEKERCFSFPPNPYEIKGTPPKVKSEDETIIVKMEETFVSKDDFSRICRVCLLSNDLLPLQATNKIALFERITNIKVENDYNLPENICKICVKFLEDIEKFIDQTTYNNNLLLNIHNLKTETDELSLDEMSDSKGDDNNLTVAVQSFKLNCKECNQTFKSKSTLAKHMKAHAGIKPYECSHCDRSFAFPGDLKIHTRTHTGITPYRCTLCNKSYCSFSGLKRHNKACHSDSVENKNKSKDIQCEFCEKLINPLGYGAHLRIHNKLSNTSKTFICQYCAKPFNSQSHLDRHIRIHTGERPFVCIICGKSFALKEVMKRHEERHSDKKRHQCQHCGQLFSRRLYLNNHVTAKHESKQKSKSTVLCTTCGKSFSHIESLKVHSRLHEGYYPFPCTHCDKRFTNAGNLKRHVIRNHASGKTHVCPTCGNSFYQLIDLSKHVEKMHPGPIN